MFPCMNYRYSLSSSKITNYISIFLFNYLKSQRILFLYNKLRIKQGGPVTNGSMSFQNKCFN